MTQAFCRLCAVFGGIQFLRFPLAAFTLNSSTNQCTGIVATTGERFHAKDAVICNHAYMKSISESQNAIHRIVLLTNQSIKASEKEDVCKKKFTLSSNSNVFRVYVDHISSSK